LLAYEMTVASRLEVAMVLPLPVPPSTAEDAVRFLDLSGYASFLRDLRSGFPDVSRGFGPPVAAAAPQAIAKLVVHDVGAFEASFVPRVADFERLDPRFRLARQTWDALPAHRDWGFAVFKLKGLSSSPKPIHPMALDFPRRDEGRLFLPTVHVHDGAVHANAAFDHTLYCQATALPGGWEASFTEARFFLPEVAFTLGLADPRERCFRLQLHGNLPNADTYAPG
jgi:hypothetical protein